MIKTYPRSWLDLKFQEVVSVLFQGLNFPKARKSTRVSEFEKAFAAYIGVKEAVAFPSARTATYFSLKALNFQEGSEVIMPAFTFWVDAAMVILAGLKPVFVDVDFRTMNIDTDKIQSAITEKTCAIYPTHLNGRPADMAEVQSIAEDNGLKIIEDCARACGATYKGKKVGSFGIGVFSFGFGKSFYDFGGSMVTSNDETFLRHLREIKKNFRNVTVKEFYIPILKGLLLKYLTNPYFYRIFLYPKVYRYKIEGNQKCASYFRYKTPHYETFTPNLMSDLTDIQAKIGIEQIDRIDNTNARRIENAKMMNHALADVEEIMIPPLSKDRRHVNVHYAVWTIQKETLQSFLIKNGIDAQDESAMDLSKFDRFKRFVSHNAPNAAKLHDRIIFLPTHPNLGEKDIIHISDKVREFFNQS